MTDSPPEAQYQYACQLHGTGWMTLDELRAHEAEKHGGSIITTQIRQHPAPDVEGEGR